MGITTLKVLDGSLEADRLLFFPGDGTNAARFEIPAGKGHDFTRQFALSDVALIEHIYKHGEQNAWLGSFVALLCAIAAYAQTQSVIMTLIAAILGGIMGRAILLLRGQEDIHLIRLTLHDGRIAIIRCKSNIWRHLQTHHVGKPA